MGGTILGVDTGKINIGCVVSEVKDDGIPEPVEWFLLDTGGNKDLKETIKYWKLTLRELKNHFCPDLLILERLMHRPGRGTAPVEWANIFIGLSIAVLEPKDFYLVMPATWKTWFRRVFGCEPMELDLPFDNNSHLCDAYAMTLYMIAKLQNI